MIKITMRNGKLVIDIPEYVQVVPESMIETAKETMYGHILKEVADELIKVKTTNISNLEGVQYVNIININKNNIKELEIIEETI